MEQLFDNLGEIKEQLFDAPTEIKHAFNDVVQYFSYTKTWYVICETNGNPRFRDHVSTGKSAADVENEYKKAIEEGYINLKVLRVKAFPAKREYLYPEKSRGGKMGKMYNIKYDEDAVEKWKNQSK
jgi:hypothetical protein